MKFFTIYLKRAKKHIVMARFLTLYEQTEISDVKCIKQLLL